MSYVTKINGLDIQDEYTRRVFETHVINRQNPHSVTAQQVGAVPLSDFNELVALISAILPAPWTSKAYEVGEVVMKDGLMYQANTNTGSTWISAQWTQVRIGNAAVLTYEEV